VLRTPPSGKTIQMEQGELPCDKAIFCCWDVVEDLSYSFVRDSLLFHLSRLADLGIKRTAGSTLAQLSGGTGARYIAGPRKVHPMFAKRKKPR
jgi:hypothetical protein